MRARSIGRPRARRAWWAHAAIAVAATYGLACSSNGGGGAAAGGAPGSTETGGAQGSPDAGANGGRGGEGGSAGTGGAGVGGGTGGRLNAGAGGGAPDGGAEAGVVRDGSADRGNDAGAGYLPCPATPGTACTVLPLGDSITEGCCTAPEGGYRIELFRQAVTNHKNITFVGTLLNGPDTVANQPFPKRHEGHGGFTIAGGGNGPIAGSVTDTALSTYHPNIVLLMIGTNDINGNIDVANAPARLGQLIDEIISGAPSSLVVVASIISTQNTGTNQRVRTYNATIPGLVNARAAMGKHVVFLDNYAAFSLNPNFATALMADGLHPNDAGYVVLGQSYYSAIAAVLPASP
jgi:lysophospholipase L1-like esterase